MCNRQLSQVLVLAAACLAGQVALSGEPVHPHLLFTAQDLPALKAKLETPEGKIIWSKLKAFADRSVKDPLPLWDKVEKEDASKRTGLDKRPPLVVLEYAGYRLWAFAMAHVLTGDAAYLDAARGWLTTLSAWPDFADSENRLGLGFAHTLGGFCFAYDCLYNVLSSEERGRYREKIRLEMEYQYQNSHKEWWAWTVIQNHGCWHAGAQILAALALEGEVPEAAKWLKEGLDCARLLDEGTKGKQDGSWAEGFSYQHYGQQGFSPALYSLSTQRRFDPWEENRYLKGYPLWHLYNYVPADPDRILMDFGDISFGGRRSLISVLPLYLCAWRYKDARAVWLARELLQNCKVDWFPADSMALALILLNPNLVPVGPEKLPLDAHFKELEGVIFRSSWDKDGLLFGLKCGPYGGRWNFDRKCANELPYNAEARKARGERNTESEYSMGHSHMDAGTFWINWQGVDLTRKVSGYGTKSTKLHNVVLVNDGEQFRCDDKYAGSPIFAKSGASTPIMLSEKDFAYCVADVGPRYVDNKTGENPLNEFTRHVLYVRRDQPGYFIMVDRLAAKEASTFKWTCHFIGGAEREEQWIKGKADNALRNRQDGKWVTGKADLSLLLGVNVLAPIGFQFETGTHSDVADKATGPVPIPKFVHISNPEKQSEMRFVLLLWPTTENEWRNKPVATLVKEDGHELQLTVKVGERVDRIQIVYGVKGTATVK